MIDKDRKIERKKIAEKSKEIVKLKKKNGKNQISEENGKNLWKTQNSEIIQKLKKKTYIEKIERSKRRQKNAKKKKVDEKSEDRKKNWEIENKRKFCTAFKWVYLRLFYRLERSWSFFGKDYSADFDLYLRRVLQNLQ